MSVLGCLMAGRFRRDTAATNVKYLAHRRSHDSEACLSVVYTGALTVFRTVPVTMNIKEEELNIVDVYADTFDQRMDEIV